MTETVCKLAYGIGEFAKILTGMAEEFGELSESICISDLEADSLNDEKSQEEITMEDVIEANFFKPLFLVMDGIGGILERATAKIDEI
jgi:hypothetical protein